MGVHSGENETRLESAFMLWYASDGGTGIATLRSGTSEIGKGFEGGIGLVG